MSSETNLQIAVRELRDGEWYWVPKVLIRQYASMVKSSGIAVYSFLASMADRNQRCFPSQQYIAHRLGCSRQTVNEALKRLEQFRFIKRDRRNRYHLEYQLLHVRCQELRHEMSNSVTSDVQNLDTNKKQLTRLINKNVVGVKKLSMSENGAGKSREEILAADIADGLGENDPKKFLRYAKAYEEAFLREILSHVKQTRVIKKSRTALFIYLLKHYEK